MRSHAAKAARCQKKSWGPCPHVQPSTASRSAIIHYIMAEQDEFGQTWGRRTTRFPGAGEKKDEEEDAPVAEDLVPGQVNAEEDDAEKAEGDGGHDEAAPEEKPEERKRDRRQLAEKPAFKTSGHEGGYMLVKLLSGTCETRPS